MQRRAVGTRDDGDDARESGESPLSLRSEQAVGGETRARDLERFATKAVALGLDANDGELHLTARRVDREASERGDEHAVIGRRGNPPLITVPHDATNLRPRVAESEIPMSVPVRLEVGDFAAHPNRDERALENVAGRLSECGDGYRRLGGLAGVARRASVVGQRLFDDA